MIYKPKTNVTYNIADTFNGERIQPTPTTPYHMECSWEGYIHSNRSEQFNHTYSGLITADVKPGYVVEQPFALCGYFVNHYNTSGDDWSIDFNIFRFIESNPNRLYNTSWNQAFDETTYIVDTVSYEWSSSSEFSRVPRTGPYGAQVGAYADDDYYFDIEVNFPVFDTLEHAIAYVSTGSLEGLLNGSAEFDENTVDYYIYTSHKQGTAKNGSVTWTEGVATFCFERILAQEGSLALYLSSEPNVYMLKHGPVVGSYYSSTSKPDVENADPLEFTDGTLEYEGPFYQVYDKSWGNGTWEMALPTRDLMQRNTTNIPIFTDEEQAEDYLNGVESIENAVNYSYLSDSLGDTVENTTGQKEELTVLGVNNSRGVFSVDYCMARSGLASLGGDFFSTNYLEDMKKGLELYGNNPMNAVMGCIYFPFDVSQIYSTVGVNFVSFGSYSHPVEGYGISKILFNTGAKSLGSTYIKPTYRNFLDYTATEIYCFLPYVGWVNLDVNKYMDTTLEIKYSVDLHSGECCAMLLSNGRLMDSYDGQIGIKQAITAEDLSSYFQAQIGGIKQAMGAVAGGAVTGAMTGAKGGAYGAVAGAVVGGTAGTIGAGVTLYGLSKMHPQMFSSGGYSGSLGCNLPQYPIIVFCYHDTEEPANLINTYGKPSNKSGRLSDFSGFLSVNSVNLNCGTATNEEKDEILQYLNSGIII